MITTLEGRQLDKFEVIACNSSFQRSILGNPKTGKFELYAPNQLVNNDQSLTEICRDLQARAFCYYGVAGIIDGATHTAFTCEFDPAITAALKKRFVEELEAYATAEVREEVERWVFARWLNRIVQENVGRTDT